MLQQFSVKAAASSLNVTPRTVRRWIAAGIVQGAHQVDTPSGPAWYLPLAAVEGLRSRVAIEAQPVEAASRSPQAAQAPDSLAPLAQPPQFDSGPLAASLGALHAALASQSATIEAQRHQLDLAQQIAERAQHDSLWWRCETLDARQQLDQARGDVAQLRQQLAAAQGEAAHFRAQVERHQRPTIPLAEIRAQLRIVEGR